MHVFNFLCTALPPDGPNMYASQCLCAYLVMKYMRKLGSYSMTLSDTHTVILRPLYTSCFSSTGSSIGSMSSSTYSLFNIIFRAFKDSVQDCMCGAMRPRSIQPLALPLPRSSHQQAVTCTMTRLLPFSMQYSSLSLSLGSLRVVFCHGGTFFASRLRIHASA